MNTAVASVSMLALLLAGAAGAVVPPADPLPDAGYRTDLSPGFAELDRNNDGVLDADEVPPGHELASRFAQYDRDNDATLSREEFDLYMHGDDGSLAGADDEAQDDDDEDEDRQD